VTGILVTERLGKRYRGRWALQDCTLTVPAGHVVGLLGPNGAGKSTLLNLAAGLLTPTAGTVRVCGVVPAADAAALAQVGFVAQDTPLYMTLSVADHLRLGERLNPGWDAAWARRRVKQLGLAPQRKAGQLSGGQRAQLALTLAVARRPRLLLLDEPVASLDPLARREFLQVLMEAVAEHDLSVVLSSHLVSDVERVCDHLVLLTESHVRLAGDVDDLITEHVRLVGPRYDPARLPRDMHVVNESHTDRQSTLVVRTQRSILDPAWAVTPLGLEDLVLAYLTAAGTRGPAVRLEVAS